MNEFFRVKEIIFIYDDFPTRQYFDCCDKIKELKFKICLWDSETTSNLFTIWENSDVTLEAAIPPNIRL